MAPSNQRTFSIIPNPLPFGVPPPNAPMGKPPMTSKQARKLYNQSTRVPRRSRAEQRQWERQEQERIRKELQKEQAASKARAARERKKAKEQAVQDEKRKQGLPLAKVRPSQDTISRFIRGFGAKRANVEDSDKENSEPIAAGGRKRRRLVVEESDEDDEDDENEENDEPRDPSSPPPPPPPAPQSELSPEAPESCPPAIPALSQPKDPNDVEDGWNGEGVIILTEHAVSNNREIGPVGRNSQKLVSQERRDTSSRERRRPSSSVEEDLSLHANSANARCPAVVPDPPRRQTTDGKAGAPIPLAVSSNPKQLHAINQPAKAPSSHVTPETGSRAPSAHPSSHPKEAAVHPSTPSSRSHEKPTSRNSTRPAPSNVTTEMSPNTKALDAQTSFNPISKPPSDHSHLRALRDLPPSATNASSAPVHPNLERSARKLESPSRTVIPENPPMSSKPHAPRTAGGIPLKSTTTRMHSARTGSPAVTTATGTTPKPATSLPPRQAQNFGVTAMAPPPRPQPSRQPRPVPAPSRPALGPTQHLPAQPQHPPHAPQMPQAQRVPAHAQLGSVPPTSTQMFLLENFDDFLPSPSQEVRELQGDANENKKTTVFTKPKPLQPTRLPTVSSNHRPRSSRKFAPPPAALTSHMPPPPSRRIDIAATGLAARPARFAGSSRPAPLPDSDLPFFSTQDVMLSSQDLREVVEPSTTPSARAKSSMGPPRFLKRANPYIPTSAAITQRRPESQESSVYTPIAPDRHPTPLPRLEKSPELNVEQPALGTANLPQRGPDSIERQFDTVSYPPAAPPASVGNRGNSQVPPIPACPPNPNPIASRNRGRQATAPRSSLTRGRQYRTEAQSVEASFDSHDIELGFAFARFRNHQHRAPPATAVASADRQESTTSTLQSSGPRRPAPAQPISQTKFTTASSSSSSSSRSTPTARRPPPNHIDHGPTEPHHHNPGNHRDFPTKRQSTPGGTDDSEAPDSQGRTRFFTSSCTRMMVCQAKEASLRTFEKEERMRKQQQQAEEEEERRREQRRRKRVVEEEAECVAAAQAQAKAEAEAKAKAVSAASSAMVTAHDHDHHDNDREKDRDASFSDDIDFDSLMLVAEAEAEASSHVANHPVPLQSVFSVSAVRVPETTAVEQLRSYTQETDYGDLDFGESLDVLDML